MPLDEARARFFERGRLGPDGGYSDRWVRVETKPIAVYFPNSNARVAAARLHDLHHIAAEYETDWPGEIEISGWEIASGCERYHAAWLLDLGGWAVGLLLAPRRLFRAFLRGRHATSNLYHSGFDETQLSRITVGMLRDRLGVRREPPPATTDDLAKFAMWSAAAVGVWVALPLAATAAGWLALSTSRRLVPQRSRK